MLESFDYPTIVSSVGFPIAAYFFTAYSLKGTIDKNTDAINEMSKVIATCPKK